MAFIGIALLFVVSGIIATVIYFTCTPRKVIKKSKATVSSSNFNMPLQSNNADISYNPQTADTPINNKYIKLGGWLAFFAYCNLVGVLGILAVVIWGIVTLAPLVRYSSIVMISIVLLVGICAFGTFWWIKIFLMIKKKDSRILKFYEICAIVYIGYELLTVFSGGFTTNIIGRMLVTIIGQLIIELYFRNSVRVRTYFGSDEFIRQSLFKNWGIESSTNQVNYVSHSSTTNFTKMDSDVAYTKCANCGASISESDAFCAKCGNPRQDEFCKHCGTKFSSDAAFCSKCGNPR